RLQVVLNGPFNRFRRILKHVFDHVELDLAAYAQVDYIAGQCFLILIGEQAERGHGASFDSLVNGPNDIFLARLAFSFFLLGRCELENTLAVVARMRTDPGSSRSATIAGESVAMETMPPVQRAPLRQGGLVQLQRPGQLLQNFCRVRAPLDGGMRRRPEHIGEYLVKLLALRVRKLRRINKKALTILRIQSRKQNFGEFAWLVETD